MAPKRKEAPEEENDAPPAGPLKTKRFVVNLTRIKGSMGLGIDDQYYVTAVKEGGAAEKDGSIEIGDHILEINGVETGTLNRPIAKILPTNPDAPVKMRLARYSAAELKKRLLTEEEAAADKADYEGAPDGDEPAAPKAAAAEEEADEE
eukprot:CAMPEP_0118818150 /NCGR_PEP_ID=MMETSP1162-20130426/5930_1 /TAXON_ID=33656 /ORGANISM="Phaeocystis Sp, Strain CCMP2710" /LENGTH=148 /DNA_ID=CAMNT_0006748309 /DNA_START=25 /DNA_END=471 /DNA_ORIENTATION=-